MDKETETTGTETAGQEVEGFSEDPREVLQGVEFGEEPKDEEPKDTEANGDDVADGEGIEVADQEGAEGETSQKAEEPEAEDDQGKAEEPEAPEVKEPTWTVDGETLNQSQILDRMQKDPAFLNRMMQRSLQAPHYQQLYEEARRQAEMAQQQAYQVPVQQAQVPQQVAPPPAQAVVETFKAYEPGVRQFISSLAEAYPEDDFVQSLETQMELAPGMMSIVGWMYDQLAATQGVVQTILPLVQEVGQGRYERMAQERLESIVDSVGQEVEAVRDGAIRSALIAALKEDEVIRSLPPQVLFSDEALPLISRTVKGLLYDVAGQVPAAAQQQPAGGSRKRASGPPANRRSAPPPTDLRDRLFGEGLGGE